MCLLVYYYFKSGINYVCIHTKIDESSFLITIFLKIYFIFKLIYKYNNLYFC